MNGVHAGSGTQLWSAAYDEPLRIEAAPAEQERIARAIAAVAAPYGPVFEAELARITAAPRERLGTADCMLEYYAYRRDFAAALHAEAVGQVHGRLAARVRITPLSARRAFS